MCVNAFLRAFACVCVRLCLYGITAPCGKLATLEQLRPSITVILYYGGGLEIITYTLGRTSLIDLYGGRTKILHRVARTFFVDCQF